MFVYLLKIMREKLAIFLDTKKHSGGAYQELIYMIDRLDTLYKGKIEIVIGSLNGGLEIFHLEEFLQKVLENIFFLIYYHVLIYFSNI